MKKLLISLINFYQNFLSFDKGILTLFAPGGACRSEIRCSDYAKQKILESGIAKGCLLSLKRIWNCR